MRWVAEVVEVPWIWAFAALAPPTAWTANAAMSKQVKMMIYDIGLKYAFAFPTIIVLPSETDLEWFTELLWSSITPRSRRQERRLNNRFE